MRRTFPGPCWIHLLFLVFCLSHFSSCEKKDSLVTPPPITLEEEKTPAPLKSRSVKATTRAQWSKIEYVETPSLLAKSKLYQKVLKKMVGHTPLCLQELNELILEKETEQAIHLRSISDNTAYRDLKQSLEQITQNLQTHRGPGTLKEQIEEEVLTVGQHNYLNFNMSYNSIFDPILYGKIQDQSGTNLYNYFIRSLFSTEQYESKHFVVIFRPGRTLPGRIYSQVDQNGEQDFYLEGIETTAYGPGRIQFGKVKELSIPIRVIGLTEYTLLSIFQSDLKDIHELIHEAQAKLAAKFSIPLAQIEKLASSLSRETSPVQLYPVVKLPDSFIHDVVYPFPDDELALGLQFGVSPNLRGDYVRRELPSPLIEKSLIEVVEYSMTKRMVQIAVPVPQFNFVKRPVYIDSPEIIKKEPKVTFVPYEVKIPQYIIKKVPIIIEETYEVKFPQIKFKGVPFEVLFPNSVPKVATLPRNDTPPVKAGGKTMRPEPPMLGFPKLGPPDEDLRPVVPVPKVARAEKPIEVGDVLIVVKDLPAVHDGIELEHLKISKGMSLKVKEITFHKQPTTDGRCHVEFLLASVGPDDNEGNLILYWDNGFQAELKKQKVITKEVLIKLSNGVLDTK